MAPSAAERYSRDLMLELEQAEVRKWLLWKRSSKHMQANKLDVALVSEPPPHGASRYKGCLETRAYDLKGNSDRTRHAPDGQVLIPKKKHAHANERRCVQSTVT
jgi:hypothetical protein